MSFDVSRAQLMGPDLFPRFAVPAEGTSLSHAGLRSDDEVLVLERGGAQLALSMLEMDYFHLAQGTLAGEAFAVSF